MVPDSSSSESHSHSCRTSHCPTAPVTLYVVLHTQDHKREQLSRGFRLIDSRPVKSSDSVSFKNLGQGLSRLYDFWVFTDNLNVTDTLRV